MPAWPVITAYVRKSHVRCRYKDMHDCNDLKSPSWGPFHAPRSTSAAGLVLACLRLVFCWLCSPLSFILPPQQICCNTAAGKDGVRRLWGHSSAAALAYRCGVMFPQHFAPDFPHSHGACDTPAAGLVLASMGARGLVGRSSGAARVGDSGISPMPCSMSTFDEAGTPATHVRVKSLKDVVCEWGAGVMFQDW